MFKAVVLVCALALLIQTISGACIEVGLAEPCGYAGSFGHFGAYDGMSTYGAYRGYGPASIAASYGGGLEVSSVSSYPNGLSVFSENNFEGPLAVVGALPFLGAVALEGALPTAGAGAVNYGCGNGAIAILEENSPAVNAASMGFGSYGHGFGSVGENGCGFSGIPGLFRSGCGCSAHI